MSLVFYSDNAFSQISDADGYEPPFDTTGLMRAEIFALTGIGGNLMPDQADSVVVGSPSMVEGTPFASFSNNASVANLDLGMPDSDAQTWILVWNKAGSSLQRLIMSSYGSPVGASLMIDETAKLKYGSGYKTISTGVNSTKLATLSDPIPEGASFLSLVINGKTTTAKNHTNGDINTFTLTSDQQFTPGSSIHVGKGAASLWGNAAATNQIAAYMVFNRVLSDSEIQTIRQYLLDNIQDVYPGVTF